MDQQKEKVRLSEEQQHPRCIGREPHRIKERFEWYWTNT